MLNQSIKYLKYQGELGYQIVKWASTIVRFIKRQYLSDKVYISRRFLESQDYPINWDNPQSLNEKLQVLKWQCNKDLHATVSDKYAVREFVKERFGVEYLIPLVFESTEPNEILERIIPDYPVIVKANHDAGSNFIIRDKKMVDWKKLQTDCRWWLTWNYYYADREHQYKNIEKRIIIEKLLITKDGKIPNDYKLNYINGNLEFVYVSIDRETSNYRKIYDADWKPLNFKWSLKSKLEKFKNGPEITPPDSWRQMKLMGAEIAKLFPYVRVDFYDVDGQLFFGEITLCHGGGFFKFEPQSVDFELGKKLKI
jgi:hypothetical protein